VQREFQQHDSVSNPSCPLREPLVVRPKLPSHFDKLCSHVCARCIYLHRIWDDQRALVDSDSAAPTVDFGASASLPGPNPINRRRCRSPGHHDERARDDELRSVVPNNAASDAGANTGADAAADAAADVASDPGTNTGANAGAVAATDATANADADASANAGSDATAPAGAIAGADAAADTGANASASADTSTDASSRRCGGGDDAEADSSSHSSANGRADAVADAAAGLGLLCLCGVRTVRQRDAHRSAHVPVLREAVPEQHGRLFCCARRACQRIVSDCCADVLF
jgi:hypothetical protein